MAEQRHLPQTNRGRALDPFSMLQSQIDRLFEDFGAPAPAATSGFLTPAIDLKETDKAFDIVAELPGVEKGDIDLRVAKDQISIRAEKKRERKEEDEDYHLYERRFGSMQRVLPFSCEIDTGKIDASFEDGVLRVHAPKAPEAQNREKKIKLS